MVKSILSPKVEIRINSLNGKGIFAKENIKSGEIVFIKGGHILTRDKIYSSGVINSYFPISDEYFLAAENKDEEETAKIYLERFANPSEIAKTIYFLASDDSSYINGEYLQLMEAINIEFDTHLWLKFRY